MRQMGYLVIEGPHDVEFACRLLKDRVGLSRVSKEEELEPRMKSLVPSKFPHGGDLLARVPVPVFLQNDGWAIAIHSAGGDSKIANCLIDTLTLLSPTDFFAIGAFLDSDSATGPAERHARLLQLMRSAPIEFPARPGEVSNGPPRSGVYVLPDNAALGTLEDVLLECGEVAYPNHLQAANDFIAAALPHCPPQHFRQLHLPAGRKKALLSSVSTLLRPGKAVQVSIQEDSWLSAQSLQLDRLRQVLIFLERLFGL